MKKKLLIITKGQFGYNIDSYHHCLYLKDEFDITYICFDVNLTKRDEDGINVVYISHEGSFLQKAIRFVKTSRKYINKKEFDLIFIVYFQSVFLLGLMSKSHNIILDIRTGAVGYGVKKRKINDFIIKSESKFFRNISIISSCLKNRLGINEEKTHILPLGSDSFSIKKKQYNNLNLLYVGRFQNRNIHETIYGLKIFLDANRIEIDITYDIIGFGNDNEVKKLTDAIDKTNLHGIITLHGRVPHMKLKPFFERCNVGICYVPVTDYFNCQPATKMFEYINSGLVCIATNTDENKIYINNENGLLCEDTPSSFAKSLEELNKKKQEYETENIRKTLEELSWSNIVNNNLKPYLGKIIDG